MAFRSLAQTPRTASRQIRRENSESLKPRTDGAKRPDCGTYPDATFFSHPAGFLVVQHARESKMCPLRLHPQATQRAETLPFACATARGLTGLADQHGVGDDFDGHGARGPARAARSLLTKVV